MILRVRRIFFEITTFPNTKAQPSCEALVVVAPAMVLERGQEAATLEVVKVPEVTTKKTLP
mgnify:CR=1 FL=1